MTLFHYTCRQAAARVTAAGVLVPVPQPILGGIRLAWLTDLERLDDPRSVFGPMGRHTHAGCRRTAVRLTVEAPEAVPWLTFVVRYRVTLTAQAHLHRPGTRPERWWVSTRAVRVLADPPN